MAYMNKLSQGNDDWRRNATEGHEIKANMNDNNIWASCNNCCHMLEEVLKALRVFNGAELVMGKA